MSDKVKDLEPMKLPNGEELAVDPMLLIESIDDVSAITNAHAQILTAVKSIVQRAIASGLKPDEAAGIALTLQQRAQQKANTLVHMDPEEASKDDLETPETANAPAKTNPKA